MTASKRKAEADAIPKKRFGKVSLLPMSTKAANEMSLAHHLALATCRIGRGSQHQINELVRSVYMAYNLQLMGFGDFPIECFRNAEFVIENALSAAEKTGRWTISGPDASVIEPLLALHDAQLAGVPFHFVVQAEVQLRQFLASAKISPLLAPSTN